LSAGNTQVFFQRRVSFCGPGIKNGFEANYDRQVFARFGTQGMNHGGEVNQVSPPDLIAR